MISHAKFLVKDKSLELLPNKRDSYIGKSTIADSSKSKKSLKMEDFRDFGNPY